ncbi:MAG: hypothetical protein WCA97_14035, partial [Terriglobales bacterium]
IAATISGTSDPFRESFPSRAAPRVFFQTGGPFPTTAVRMRDQAESYSAQVRVQRTEANLGVPGSELQPSLKGDHAWTAVAT